VLFRPRRGEIESFGRHRETLGRARATIARFLCRVASFYRYAEEEGLIPSGWPRHAHSGHSGAMAEARLRRIVLVLDCADPSRLADFWTRALDYHVTGSAEPYVVLAPHDVGVELVLQRVPEPKITKNRMHVDIRTDDLEGEVERLLELGASLVDQEPIEEVGFRWFVMVDPEGNEFCVCREPIDSR
jgi:predicted enzyme related to lactoylglutathione lyase